MRWWTCCGSPVTGASRSNKTAPRSRRSRRGSARCCKPWPKGSATRRSPTGSTSVSALNATTSPTSSASSASTRSCKRWFSPCATGSSRSDSRSQRAYHASNLGGLGRASAAVSIGRVAHREVGLDHRPEGSTDGRQRGRQPGELYVEESIDGVAELVLEGARGDEDARADENAQEERAVERHAPEQERERGDEVEEHHLLAVLLALRTLPELVSSDD